MEQGQPAQCRQPAGSSWNCRTSGRPPRRRSGWSGRTPSPRLPGEMLLTLSGASRARACTIPPPKLGPTRPSLQKRYSTHSPFALCPGALTARRNCPLSQRSSVLGRRTCSLTAKARMAVFVYAPPPPSRTGSEAAIPKLRLVAALVTEAARAEGGAHLLPEALCQGPEAHIWWRSRRRPLRRRPAPGGPTWS